MKAPGAEASYIIIHVSVLQLSMVIFVMFGSVMKAKSPLFSSCMHMVTHGLNYIMETAKLQSCTLDSKYSPSVF